MADKLDTMPCGPCQVENKRAHAVGYCQYCHHYLCQSCYDYHQNLGRIHKLLDRDSMPHRSIPVEEAQAETCTEVCRDHQHKALELYCKNHDEVCCVICVTSKHKHCDYIYIPDYTKHLTKSQSDECSRVLHHVKNLVSQFMDLKLDTAKRQKDLEKQKREFGSEVRRFRKEIDAVLDQLEKQVMTDMKQFVEKENTQMSNNIAKCEKALKELDDTVKTAKEAMANGGVNKVFTVSKTSNKMHNDMSAVLRSVKDTSFEVSIKFDENFPLLKNVRGSKYMGKVQSRRDAVRFTNIGDKSALLRKSGPT